MKTAERMKELTDTLTTWEDMGFEDINLNLNEVKFLIEQAQTNQVSIVKSKKGIPTVIEYNGDRYTYDSQTTFRGGVGRGKQNKSTK